MRWRNWPAPSMLGRQRGKVRRVLVAGQGSLDMLGQHRDPLDEVAELARKADEIDHNRNRSDDHCHIFHSVASFMGISAGRYYSDVAIDRPNWFIFVLLACCACAGAKAISTTPTPGPDPKEEAPARERRGQNQVETSLTGHKPTIMQSISKY
jgi:hypothetical protein